MVRRHWTSAHPCDSWATSWDSLRNSRGQIHRQTLSKSVLVPPQEESKDRWTNLHCLQGWMRGNQCTHDRADMILWLLLRGVKVPTLIMNRNKKKPYRACTETGTWQIATSPNGISLGYNIWTLASLLSVSSEQFRPSLRSRPRPCSWIIFALWSKTCNVAFITKELKGLD